MSSWSRDQRRHSEVVAVLHTDAPVDNGEIALYKETRQANRVVCKEGLEDERSRG